MSPLVETREDLALFRHVPGLRVPCVRLGRWPTPLEPFEEGLIKRDDLSSPIYGGNKVRCLEFLFGEALALGRTHVEAIGAHGTNHGVATLLHAPRVGLSASATIFRQPASETASANLRVLRRAHRPPLHLPHWFFLPFALPFRRLRLENAYVMAPGGATPRGALGYVSAALELAEQIGPDSDLEAVVVGVGSTCTSAGLLAGFALARNLGLLRRSPRVVAVRVTPWPVTSHGRIVSLARRALGELAERSGDSALTRARDLGAVLTVDGSELGRGYGYPTKAGRHALSYFRDRAGFELDTTYSAKAAAAFLRWKPRMRTLFWSTKSTAPLPYGAAQPTEAA
ncbi:MAG: pyridoxal-phosphate dependent enzyme [Myxococcota bacterium]